MKNNLPFYYRTWFISLLFLVAPFTLYITAIAAIGLLLNSRIEFPMINKEEAEKAKQLITEAEKSASKIVKEAKKQKKEIQAETDTLKTEISAMNVALSEKADDILFKQTTVNFTDGITSSEIKSELSIIQLKEKEMIKNNSAVFILSSEKKTIANKQAKQLLRAFNAEADYYTSNVTMKNVDTFRNKLAKSFENLNKLFEIDGVELTQIYLKSKLKQLDVIFKYKKQIEIEKELLKTQKEEIREQQKVEKELQDAKRKIEKEEQQFNNEMSKLLKYLNSANNEVEQQIYADKIKELEEKIKLLQKDKEDVLNRESNTRAGYVYIISNIGSFGENIYKIGMTRRLEPMDRIAELSSASVPFPFDVHALIFSDDAPSLENTLHNYFRKQEVNKVNNRKEFFKVNLDEIKEVVHKEHNNTVHFTDLAVAEQYYESLKLENQNIG